MSDQSSDKPASVFEALRWYGHDEDFQDSPGEGFVATNAEPGTAEKIEVFRRRVELGYPLYHSGDCPLEPTKRQVEIPIVSTLEQSQSRKRNRSDY